DRVGLERFECDRRIAEIFEPQLVKIIAPDIHVQRVAPIVGYALIDESAAGREFLQAIGAAAERRLEGGLANIALLAILVGALPPRLGQDSELANDLRQLAITRSIESKRDLTIAGLFHFGDMAVI